MKIFMPLGDATEAMDTFYPYYRLQEDGFEVVVAGLVGYAVNDSGVVVTALVDAGYDGRIARVASKDSFIPLGDDRLLMDLDGTAGRVAASEQELSRAIIEATVDQAEFADGRTRLVKYLSETG